MKIGIVLNTSWNVYNFRMGLIKALQENGHEIVVIAPEDEYTPKLIDAGCSFQKVKMDSRGANPVKDMALIFELYRIYKNVNPDVVLHYTIKPNIYGTIAAYLRKIPAINNVCGLGTVFLQKSIVSKVASLMYKMSFRLPKKVLFQNENDQRLFVSNKLVKKEITDLVPGSGINLNAFKPQASKTKNKKFTFLLVSRLIHDKGVIEYIDAIKALKKEGVKAQFQILGATDVKHKRGISESIVREWIDTNTIEYLGKTDDVKTFINSADCVVLPSYREGTPRTLLEAASSEKPIVATDVPGCNSVVEHNYNGLLCKIKDSNDLASKMREMIFMSEDRRVMFGKNGRKKVEQEFDEKLVIDKYLEAINSVHK